MRRLGVVVVALVALAGMVAGATPAPAQPSGDPVVIGVYTPADNPTFTAPELIPAAEAAVKYVNRELDGFGGRPVRLVSCTTSYTPESLTSCANELFQEEPLLIIPGPDASAFTAFNVFQDAGVPLIGGASFTPPEYTSDIRVLFNGFSASLFPGMVHFAADKLGAEKIVALTFDDGINPILIDVFMNPITQALGIPNVQFVPTQPGTTDFTAPMAAALDTDPDAVLAYGVPCVPLTRAYASLGSDVPLIQPSNCNDARTLKQEGDAAEGTYYVNEFQAPLTNPKSKDVKLFTKILRKYGAKNIAITDFSSTGVASILNIREALEGTDLSTATPADIVAVFQGKVDAPNFLAEPYTCQPAPVERWPSICSGSVFLTRVKNGKLRAITPFVSMQELYGSG
jgi:branched-chain amino acid transport system substrate-binding protein